MKYRSMLLVVFVASLACRSEVERAKYQTLERAAFVVELPQWPKEIDSGRAGLGRVKVIASKRAFAEVSWQGGTASDMEELETLAKAVSTGFDQGSIERSQETLDDQLRVHLTASIQKRVWLAMTIIACKKTNVMVTLGFGARKRKGALAMRKRAIDSFACRGDGPAGFSGIVFPAMSLDASFGQHIEGEALLLANRAGELLYVVGGPPTVVAQARTQPNRILEIFASLLQMKLRLREGAVRTQVGLAKENQWLITADPVGDPGGPVVMGGFECPGIGQGYLVMSMSDNPSTPVAKLDAAVAQLGCPNDATPPIGQRKTACEVGYQPLCNNPDGDAP